ncbi:hypothetical protein QF031_003012 [Pseudarthrobacter defluvii]|uniref:hypothetical protein n=1 Tax=Pseudarthrobacter defluvii TaxID=410837 RepID=UPI0027825A68|nr:hypothetical protein [Pseudarthrobacter defluvii]MDQ0770263.1 hypothetical protein [Pseudarthrobacter defluvii]
MNETQSLVTSMGECSLGMVGKDHVKALSVQLDVERNHATVTVALEENTEEEQLRAFNKLAEVEMMFFDDVSMDVCLSDVESMRRKRTPAKQLAYFA